MFLYKAALSDTLNMTSQEYINIFLYDLKQIFVFSKFWTLRQHILIGNLNYKNIKQLICLYHFKIIFKCFGLKLIQIQ